MTGLGDEFVAVLRFSDHADPEICQCGHTWGHHPHKGQHVGPPGSNWFTDGGCTQCDCDEWVYDFKNPHNKYVRLMHDEMLSGRS
ncbi:MAG: hypothetical protein KGL35_08165, partial [Bradyrhizobium sp.]|nr:hypothetical protein [Bradyrhizobium sp.]